MTEEEFVSPGGYDGQQKPATLQTPESKVFFAAQNDPPSNNQNPKTVSLESNSNGYMITVAKNH